MAQYLPDAVSLRGEAAVAAGTTHALDPPLPPATDPEARFLTPKMLSSHLETKWSGWRVARTQLHVPFPSSVRQGGGAPCAGNVVATQQCSRPTPTCRPCVTRWYSKPPPTSTTSSKSPRIGGKHQYRGSCLRVFMSGIISSSVRFVLGNSIGRTSKKKEKSQNDNCITSRVHQILPPSTMNVPAIVIPASGVCSLHRFPRICRFSERMNKLYLPITTFGVQSWNEHACLTERFCDVYPLMSPARQENSPQFAHDSDQLCAALGLPACIFAILVRRERICDDALRAAHAAACVLSCRHGVTSIHIFPIQTPGAVGGPGGTAPGSGHAGWGWGAWGGDGWGNNYQYRQGWSRLICHIFAHPYVPRPRLPNALRTSTAHCAQCEVNKHSRANWLSEPDPPRQHDGKWSLQKRL
ncbi:hypothetical protein C8R43DRAFT_960211 [Mycena crocata]|nr:hypothetical protein C8R43DRAFT_960211 [Mycena crocata]